MKLFPPPVYHGESEKWEDWSWQLKSYVALYKPMALEIMGRLEGASVPCIDEHLVAFEHSNATNSNLIVFSKQLHYLLAQITDGSARLVVRLNEHGNFRNLATTVRKIFIARQSKGGEPIESDFGFQAQRRPFRSGFD